MVESLPFLIVGVGEPEVQGLREEVAECELICVPNSAGAVAYLRAHGHTVPMALLDGRGLDSELEELVVYLKSTFPEIAIAILGSVSPEERQPLELLGVVHFLERPLTREGLAPLLRRASGFGRRRVEQTDWLVTVDKSDWVEITVPSQEEYVSRIQELIDLLERSKLDQDTRDELMLAIDELVRNSMEWGNRYDENKQVRVSYYCSGDRVVLKVEDEGEGFNVSALGDPTENLQQHMDERTEAGKRPGGLGVHLIRNLMDEFIYNDRGNIVMLTKYLEAPSG